MASTGQSSTLPLKSIQHNPQRQGQETQRSWEVESKTQADTHWPLQVSSGALGWRNGGQQIGLVWWWRWLCLWSAKRKYCWQKLYVCGEKNGEPEWVSSLETGGNVLRCHAQGAWLLPDLLSPPTEDVREKTHLHTRGWNQVASGLFKFWNFKLSRLPFLKAHVIFTNLPLISRNLIFQNHFY